MVFCIPCTGLSPEGQLLKDCYPPSKALQNAGPDYKPLSQDLSKLCYRCQNQPSKLSRVSDELEKRVQNEAVRSSGGYQKSRASLLISLSILRSLITECKRDLGLFSRAIVRIVNLALDVKVYNHGGPDLEVIGRAASCFSAFTTYTDGNALGVDDALTRTYLEVVGKFGALAVTPQQSEKPDDEFQNRSRLIGLAGLNGAASSDAMFASQGQFKQQIARIVPALLSNLFESNMDHLKLETAKIETDASPSPFFSEFSARRPVNDRRAPSLHAHIPGEKGPSQKDVTSAALRSLHALLNQCQANQASSVIDACLAFLDARGWNDNDRACWLAEQMTDFISLGHRFVVPARLAEALCDIPDGQPTPKHSTLIAMLTTILHSPISLVGLGVADLLGSLVSLIIRRIRIDRQDGLLPLLVQCISSLGTHIYYVDQINDTVEEIGIRMSEVVPNDPYRSEILRVLVYCIIGVMTTATAADASDNRQKDAQSPTEAGDKGKGPALDTPTETAKRSASRRNPISIEVFQETVPLLCESTYAVRSAYTRALLLFLQHEIPKNRYASKSGYMVLARFCNAVYAALYTLAMSSCLAPGVTETPSMSVSGSPTIPTGPVPHSESPKEIAPPLPETATDANAERRGSASVGGKGVSFNVQEPSPQSTPSGSTNGKRTPPRRVSRTPRRVSLPLNRVNSSAVLSSFDNVATPYDFAAILAILDELHKAVPTAALTTGVGMLLALDADAGHELVRKPNDGRQGAWVLERKRAIREVCTFFWRQIGHRWGLPVVVDTAQKALDMLPEPLEVPTYEPGSNVILPLPEPPVMFVPTQKEGESSSTTQSLIQPEIVISALANATNVQEAAGQDAAWLTRRWTTKWTVEIALRDSVERFSALQVKPAADPHFDVANVLMSMNNPSYQSFTRPQSKVVDVADLREALGRRTDSFHGSSAPSITSTGGAPTVSDHHPGSRRPTSDAKEVLKEIFRDKRKGGRRSNGAPSNLVAPAND